MHASIIIPIQVVSEHFAVFLEHLGYAAYAAKRQSAPSEIVIVDYNSTPDYIAKIKRIAREVHAIYIRDERRDTLWSRGRSLNTGIKCALGDLLLFVDADCILPVDYAAKHLDLIDPTCFTFSEFYLTEPAVRKTGHYETLFAQKDKIKPPYDTCCSHQGILRETVTKVGMFDEVYRGWGAEEHDYIHTLKLAGIKPKQCPSMPIHLYHPTWHELMKHAGRDEEQKITRAQNKARYFNYAKTNKK